MQECFRNGTINNTSKIYCIGDLIAYANEKAATREGRTNRYTHTPTGAEYFKRMKIIALYITDTNKVEIRIKKLNLDGVFILS